MRINDLVINLQNIKKEYKTLDIVTPVLNGISLQIKKGDFYAITGPSGSGKSTLMNIIGLLDSPSDGIYEVNGQNTNGLTEDELAALRSKEIGFVFQSFNLLPKLTTLENVVLPGIYAQMKKNERENKAKELLKKLGLENRLNNRPNQLSGGQQQRVAIARALMNDPAIILADEPTGNLDTKSGDDVMEILKELSKQGKTIVLITHEANIASKAKKIIKIKDGEIVKT